jgi:hypothetical protein
LPARKWPFAFAIGSVVMVVAGCGQSPGGPAATVVPRAATHVQPPVTDWFSQQLAAARAAKRDHQPRADRAGAQRAYDDIMHTACARAALSGPGKYPSRCDEVLRPTPAQLSADPCEGNADDPAVKTECND